jgi:hypothetical protein
VVGAFVERAAGYWVVVAVAALTWTVLVPVKVAIDESSAYAGYITS